MYELMSELYPICRSITGNGVRETLKIIGKHIPLEIREVPSGTKVFDWSVPREWNIRDAYIKNSMGEKIIDFRISNLHVLSYSAPVHKKVGLKELKEHIYTLPETPEWVPYRTSYYNENWGFCMADNALRGLEEGEYEVFIDSTIENGHLTYGEYLIKGERPEEVLISCHICHPSLCNDNLSGIVISTFLARQMSGDIKRYSYRFLFIPATIGAITWLALNEQHAAKIKHGLVAACLGDPGFFTYKKTRRGTAEIDRAVINFLRYSGREHNIVDFVPFGYDERQYCSPGFNLPVGCLMRTPHSRYPEYHTSADNLEFVSGQSLQESFQALMDISYILENNEKYLNLNPKCEPQMGKRGLYNEIGGAGPGKSGEMAMLWVLNLSDGNNDLLYISERSGLSFQVVKQVSDALLRHGLLEPCPE